MPTAQIPPFFPNPNCLLTNSNVYGVTIAEHVMMVTLMLLRRLPDCQEAMRRRQWPVPSPVQSIRDADFTIIGTGNIGTNVAQRLKSMGAARVTGLSRSGRQADGALFTFHEGQSVLKMNTELNHELYMRGFLADWKFDSLPMKKQRKPSAYAENPAGFQIRRSRPPDRGGGLRQADYRRVHS